MFETVTDWLIRTFSSRELATAAWATAFFCWAMRHGSVRRSAWNVVRTLGKTRKLVLVGVLAAAYSGAVVYVLAEIGVWTPDLLKSTVLWFLFPGLSLLFSELTRPEDPAGLDLYRALLADHLKVLVVYEFVVGTYTFPFWVEVILVPAVALPVALLELAKRNENEGDASVARFLNGFLGIVGMMLIVGLVDLVSSDPGPLMRAGALREFLLPLVMSLALTPFAYLFLVLARYEMLNTHLRLNRQLSSSEKRQAMWLSVRHLGLSAQRVSVFLSQHALALHSISSPSELGGLLKSDCPGSSEAQ